MKRLCSRARQQRGQAPRCRRGVAPDRSTRTVQLLHAVGLARCRLARARTQRTRQRNRSACPAALSASPSSASEKRPLVRRTPLRRVPKRCVQAFWHFQFHAGRTTLTLILAMAVDFPPSIDAPDFRRPAEGFRNDYPWHWARSLVLLVNCFDRPAPSVWSGPIDRYDRHATGAPSCPDCSTCSERRREPIDSREPGHLGGFGAQRDERERR